MKKNNLKDVMREHIEKQSLSDKQLKTLLNMQNDHAENSRVPLQKRYQWLAYAAVLFLVMGNLIYFSMSPPLPLEQRIGSEVAKNHIKLKPLEVQSSSLQTVSKYFTELDFLPIESVLLKDSSHYLIGGRYCSIQGITAAQLRLKDSKTGHIQSLYQTVYDKKVFSGLPELKENQKPITVYSKGIAVDIWVEKGLLFALTH